MKYKKITEDILIYAFRYALGRKTYAVSVMCELLKENWDKLADHTKDSIKKEIISHEELYGDLGHDCDKDEWYSLLKYEGEKKNEI